MGLIVRANPQSRYGVVDSFTASLRAALKRQGAAARLPGWTLAFNDCRSRPGWQHMALIIDSVVHHPECLQVPCHVAFVEHDSCWFYQRVTGKHALYVPHAVDRKLFNHEVEGKRPYSIAMPASFIDGDAIYAQWKERFVPQSLAAITETVEEALACSSPSWLQLVCERLMGEERLEQLLAIAPENFCELAREIELYLRAIGRNRLLATLAERGVHVWCSAADREQWQRIQRGGEVHYHDAVPFKQLPRLLRQCRVVVNCEPSIRSGLHERFLTALACGASVLSSTSRCLQEEWAPSAAVQYYTGGSDVGAAIDLMLADEPARLTAAQAARLIVQERHTWDVRAQRILGSLGV